MYTVVIDAGDCEFKVISMQYCIKLSVKMKLVSFELPAVTITTKLYPLYKAGLFVDTMSLSEFQSGVIN